MGGERERGYKIMLYMILSFKHDYALGICVLATPTNCNTCSMHSTLLYVFTVNSSFVGGD